MLERTSKAFVLILGLFYGVGLTVNSIYLARFGSVAVSLARAQYVATGISALLPVFLVLYGFLFAVSREDGFLRLTREAEAEEAGAWFSELGSNRIFIRRLFVYSFISAFVGEATLFFFSFSVENWFWTFFVCTIVSFTAVGAASAIFVVAGPGSLVFGKGRRPWVQVLARLAVTPFAVFLCFAHLGAFAMTAFPYLPAAVGGAKPIRVDLVLNRSGAGQPTTADVISAEVLAETSSEIVVRTGSSERRFRKADIAEIRWSGP